MSKKHSLTDEELIQLVQKDDKAAFSEIYSRYAEPLAGFAASRLHDIEDARDVLHDLFVNLWENRGSLVISTNLRAYLFASIRYKIIDVIRRNITREEYRNSLATLANPEVGYIDNPGDTKDLRKLVDSALNQLSPRTKQIYQLSREQYYSVSEIAKTLGLSEQTIKNQLSIALKHLRTSITGISILALFVGLIKK